MVRLNTDAAFWVYHQSRDWMIDPYVEGFGKSCVFDQPTRLASLVCSTEIHPLFSSTLSNSSIFSCKTLEFDGFFQSSSTFSTNFLEFYLEFIDEIFHFKFKWKSRTWRFSKVLPLQSTSFLEFYLNSMVFPWCFPKFFHFSPCLSPVFCWDPCRASHEIPGWPRAWTGPWTRKRFEPRIRRDGHGGWLVINIGWCFGTWLLFFQYWECHHPNWRTHIFQRGRSTTNQYRLVIYSG